MLRNSPSLNPFSNTHKGSPAEITFVCTLSGDVYVRPSHHELAVGRYTALPHCGRSWAHVNASRLWPTLEKGQVCDNLDLNTRIPGCGSVATESI